MRCAYCCFNKNNKCTCFEDGNVPSILRMYKSCRLYYNQAKKLNRLIESDLEEYKIYLKDVMSYIRLHLKRW